MASVVTVLTPNQDEIFAAIGGFVEKALEGVSFYQGQVNRVPESRSSDFVEGWPLSMPRMDTNLNEYKDVSFVGAISGTTMTVLRFNSGDELLPNSVVFGADVTDDTRVVRKISDLSVGALLNAGVFNEFYLNEPTTLATYEVSKSQNVSFRILSAGIQIVTQVAEGTFQLDVHGPNSLVNAATLATLFRDEFAVDFFAETLSSISPLFTDDPAQIPFRNAEHQYENRWVVTAHLQINQSLAISQQFADQLTLLLVNATDFPA